ncbi:sulfite exporter TauE/SafE family protein [Thiosulfatihalobacter marinus]|uniref:sulfite exporter TauE/SafE family protein n=1 Tax=Thiosulfatihalobacter marinus TaxID=2792481 RepID=UPI0018D63481|nr:sulfite exporter TauE/SafE family protein [Thiosulfatihalobacter marinus]
MNDYILYFSLTLGFSTLFSMGGIGAAIALVPLFNVAGLPINLAKAIGLFVNTSSTITASVMNFRRGVLNVKATLPLIIAILLATPLGAWLSQHVNEVWVKWLLVAFLVTSGTLLLFQKREARFRFRSPALLAALGGGVGIVSGLLGVGGGSLLIPMLILLGYNAKEAGIAVGMVIPFSSFGAFTTYLGFTEMDWRLLGVVTVAAILGGYFGNRIMHFRLSPAQVKKLIGVVLYLLAAKVAFGLLV